MSAEFQRVSVFQTPEVAFKWKKAIKRKLKEAGGEMKVSYTFSCYILTAFGNIGENRIEVFQFLKNVSKRRAQSALPSRI